MNPKSPTSMSAKWGYFGLKTDDGREECVKRPNRNSVRSRASRRCK